VNTEKNPETQAFAAAYRMEDDDEEFAHLEQEEATLVGIDGAGMDDFGEENDEGEENEEREVVDAVALRAQLQRVARGEEVRYFIVLMDVTLINFLQDVETIDVNNVDWIHADDDDDMDDVVNIKEVTTTHRQANMVEGALMDWDVIQVLHLPCPLHNSRLLTCGIIATSSWRKLRGHSPPAKVGSQRGRDKESWYWAGICCDRHEQSAQVRRRLHHQPAQGPKRGPFRIVFARCEEVGKGSQCSSGCLWQTRTVWQLIILFTLGCRSQLGW
jgi:hypothetical protein